MPFCSLFVCILALSISITSANVEKSVFSAPPAIAISSDASIDNLYLISLSPSHSSARTRLNATFPTDDHPKGTETWMLVEGLLPGARYEVRICWLATQPTAFSLYGHTLPVVFETPELISSLSIFAYARQAELLEDDVKQLLARRPQPSTTVDSIKSSMLLFQIFAAADYFTLNQTLMDNVPPVLVDVILDPYVLNIFPKSLLPTAGYIFSLAIIGWFASGYVWKLLLSMAKEFSADKDKKTD